MKNFHSTDNTFASSIKWIHHDLRVQRYENKLNEYL